VSSENTSITAEDYFKGKLIGDRLDDARNLITFLADNGIMPGGGGGDFWIYRDKGLFVIHAYGDEDNNWFIYGHLENLESFPIDEGMKEFVWKNIRICTGQCGCPNWPRGGDKTVFGKEFKSVCSSVFMFQNPKNETLENIKKLVKLQLNNINNM